MDRFSYLGSADVGQIDDLYKQFRIDPASVTDSWRKFFDGFDFARTNFAENGHSSADVVPENVQKEVCEEYLVSIEKYKTGKGYSIPGEFIICLGIK